MRQKEHLLSETSGRPGATEDVMSEEVPRPPDEAEAEGAKSLWAHQFLPKAKIDPERPYFSIMSRGA